MGDLIDCRLEIQVYIIGGKTIFIWLVNVSVTSSYCVIHDMWVRKPCWQFDSMLLASICSYTAGQFHGNWTWKCNLLFKLPSFKWHHKKGEYMYFLMQTE